MRAYIKIIYRQTILQISSFTSSPPPPVTASFIRIIKLKCHSRIGVFKEYSDNETLIKKSELMMTYN